MSAVASTSKTTMRCLAGEASRALVKRGTAFSTLTTSAGAFSNTSAVRTLHRSCPQQVAPRRQSSTLSSLGSMFTSTTSSEPDYADVVVVGGGVVGLALACALGTSGTFTSSGASIALIEASSLARLQSWTSDKQSSAPIDDWENRVIYLTEENRAWLEAIGVTKHLVTTRLCPVHGMHVTDGVTNAALDFDVSNTSKSSGNNKRLGTMVEISNLQQAMLKRVSELNAKNSQAEITVLEGEKVESIEPEVHEPTRNTFQDARPILKFDGSRAPLKARLLVGADGGNSPVRRYAGIQSQGWEYGRFGVVATMYTAGQPSHDNIAFQRFLPTGTIAWLPLSSTSASLVWTLPPDIAKAIVAMQKGLESQDGGIQSPLCHLITAAFRLPWPALRRILDQIATCDVSRGMDWLGAAAEEQLVAAGMDLDESNVPSPVSSLRAKSTAAFPLKLAHAESYLGSSMRQTTIAEAGAAALSPTRALNGIVRTLAALTSSPDKVVEQAGPSAHRGRTALIGDAAHTIHPLAGQGLNLGLADARSLANTLERAVEHGADLGSHTALQAYPRERYIPNQVMLSAVDHLHWLFVSPSAPDERTSQSLAASMASRAAIWARSTGFEVLNELGPVKEAIMGAAGSTESQKRRTTGVWGGRRNVH